MVAFRKLKKATMVSGVLICAACRPRGRLCFFPAAVIGIGYGPPYHQALRWLRQSVRSGGLAKETAEAKAGQGPEARACPCHAHDPQTRRRGPGRRRALLGDHKHDSR